MPAFGAALLLHGTRALGEVPAVRTVSELPEELFAYGGAICFYFISAASYFFIDQYWGPGLRKSLRRVWQFHLVFATVAAATDLATGNPGGFMDASATLVVVYRVVLLGNIVTRSLETRREDIYVLYGIGVVLVCTVHDVRANAGVLPWTLEARPIGIVAVMAALACSILLAAAEVGSADAAIGVMEDESYATTRVGLESGDRLVFYTDGLTEAESPDGERFSVDRVKGLLAGDGDGDVERWTERLLESVRGWRGRAELQDDLTVVSLDIP